MMGIIQKIMPGPSCDDVMEVLQAYLDGEVDEKQAQKVARHLSRCTECDNESQVYLKIKETLAKHQRPIDPEVKAALQQFSQDLIS